MLKNDRLYYVLMIQNKSKLSITFLSLSKSTQSEKLLAFAMYTYDALGKRIRVRESGFYRNKTFNLDALLLYREVMTTTGMKSTQVHAQAKLRYHVDKVLW